MVKSFADYPQFLDPAPKHANIADLTILSDTAVHWPLDFAIVLLGPFLENVLLDILNCKDPPVWEKVTNKSLVMAAAEGLFWNFKVQFDFIFMADFISRLF